MQSKGVEGVTYEVMDFLDLKFENDEFEYIIDKGSFDALCCDGSEETMVKVLKYFQEISRVLAPDTGKYLCVSLLQDFVFDALLSFFLRKDAPFFDIKIYKLDKLSTVDTSSFLPFMLSISKRTDGTQS